MKEFSLDGFSFIHLEEKNVLRERRVILGLTQKEVADILGISQSYISRLEKKIICRLRREMLRRLQA